MGSVLLEGVKMEAEDDDPSDDWSDNIIVVIESVEKIKEKEKVKVNLDGYKIYLEKKKRKREMDFLDLLKV